MCIRRRPTIGCATRGSVAPSTAFGGGVAPGVTPHLVAEVEGGEKYTTWPVVSQPGGRGGGGSELGWVEHQAHPPLGHCPRDVINLKNAPTLGHSQAPPLDIVRVTSSALRKIEKHPPLGHSQAPPPLGHCPCDVIHIPSPRGGGDRSVPVTHTLHRFAKGWNKIAKGWNKILGMGNWGGGRPTPLTPPPWLRA